MIFTSNIIDWQHSRLDNTHPVSRHVWENTLALLEIIDFHEITGTFFISGKIAEKYPILVRKIYARGHEVATYSELAVSDSKFSSRFDHNVKSLEDITGSKIIGSRISTLQPEQSQLEKYCKILVKHNLKYDSSLHLPRSVGKLVDNIPELQTFSEYGIKEYHLPTFPVLGKTFDLFGGASFRIMPYAVSHYLGSLLHREKTVFCMESFDLGLGEDQQIAKSHSIPIERRQDFVGRKKMAIKLQNLLRDFPFMSFRDAYFFCDDSSPQYQPEKLYYT